MAIKDCYGVNRFDHLDLSPKLTVLEVLPNGAEVLLRKPYRDHLMDNYLETVLAWWNDSFVTWTRNTQDLGCSNGHYFDLGMNPSHAVVAQVFIEALIDYDERGHRTNYTPSAAERLRVKIVKEANG